VADPRIKELAYEAIAAQFQSPNLGFQSITNIAQTPAVIPNIPSPMQEFIKVATPTISAFEPTMSRSQSVGTIEKNEEQQFQNWIRSTGWFKEFVKEFGEEPDVNIPEYDYRAAWKAGITPERDPYDQNRYHWPSSDPSGKMLKSQEHPTAWKEFFMRDAGINPDALGLKTKEEAEAYLQGLKR